MSDSIPQPQDAINVTMQNLNEQVTAGVNVYLAHLENEPDADILTDLQSMLIDVISLCTVAYIATDKLLGEHDAAQDA